MKASRLKCYWCSIIPPPVWQKAQLNPQAVGLKIYIYIWFRQDMVALGSRWCWEELQRERIREKALGLHIHKLGNILQDMVQNCSLGSLTGDYILQVPVSCSEAKTIKKYNFTYTILPWECFFWSLQIILSGKCVLSVSVKGKRKNQLAIMTYGVNEMLVNSIWNNQQSWREISGWLCMVHSDIRYDCGNLSELGFY